MNTAVEEQKEAAEANGHKLIDVAGKDPEIEREQKLDRVRMLKAEAYDCLAQIEFLQGRLAQLNQGIQSVQMDG